MTDTLAIAAAQGEVAGLLESDLGPALPKTIGSQSVPAAAGGETDPDSMQAQGNAAAGDTSSASASLAGTTVQMGAAGGLVFDITYDSSVSSAPAGFTAAIADVVNYYRSVFSDPVTINLDVGWGEVGGQTLASGALGESETNLGLFSYSQVKAALTADAKSADDTSAVHSLPGTDPTGGGSFVLATAEAKALGLGANVAVDGYVGFSSGAAYTFDPNNRAVAGAYDFIGVAEHEISEVMGRIALVGTPLSGLSHTYTALDLFRYASPGSRQLAAGHPAYFSVDGGNTGLNNFNTAANGDAGDWASGGGNDSYNAFVSAGVAEPVTANDLRVMDAIGWDLSTAKIDTPPVVTPTSSNIAASPGQLFDASSLFTASDPDGDAITQYDFWDTGGGGGQFLVDGAAQPANGDIYVSAPQLAQTAYQSGNGTDTLWVRAYDGTQWSAWSPSFTVTSGTSADAASTASSDPAGQAAGPIILTVGPDGQYQTISDAVAFADADTNPSDNFDIQVAPGTYTNDFPEVTRPMTIEADPNATGPVVLLATELLPNDKGIILTTSSLTVRGLTFEGAAISNADGGNGAGIRDQNVDGSDPPASFIVENCTFTGNQEGILTGYDASETISIANSTFANNGNPDQGYFQHALYVNFAGSLTVTGSLFGGQLIGHDIKSRAMVTTITDNRIYDGAADPADGIGAGSTSYGIDTPNGGVVTISGNLIVQGPATQNSIMVDYGTEGLVYDSNSLSVSNNTFISTGLSQAIGIYDAFATPVQLNNNTFEGVATPVYPASAIINSPEDTPPVVTPTSSNITASPGQLFDASSLFTASDPDGDAITQYDFWDTGGGGGQFLVDGAAQPANGDIYVSAA
ncbi:MAG: NF038122 family metalloprotease, partial [Alphaproteobacteria bacterium]|nr:NF038122 family metalloprotease [Alphaproteobacteria bacterium]